MRKKVMSLFLCAVMTISLMAGCGSSSSENTTDTQDVEATEETQAEETSSEADETEQEVVSLRMIMYGSSSTRREEFFENEFHDRVLEELNIDLTVEFLAWGSADTTIPTMLASGESFAVWNVVSVYPDWITKGWLAEISEESIEKYCQNLLRVRTENNGFECVSQNGKIYAIPFGCKPYAGRMQTIEVRNDILNAVGYDAADITTYDELVEAFTAVQDAYPTMRISRDSSFLINALNSEISDQLISIQTETSFVYVDELEDGDTVYSLYESEAYKNLCEIAMDWVDRGFILMEELTNFTQGEADWSAGNCLSMYGTPGALIDTSLLEVAPEAEIGLIKIGDMPLVKSINYDWGFSISASDADNVDRWLQLFDWMYQDLETYNFCVYGVEGTDWQYAEDGTIKKLVTDTFIDSWFMEAMEYVTYDSSISEESIAQYESNDDGAILSKLAGFVFDTDPVSTELTLMTAVWSEYIEPMTLGLLSYDEYYDIMIGKLKEAGLDTYLEEYQRQYSEWYAANKQ